MKSVTQLKPFLFPNILRFWQLKEINRRWGILEGISTLCIYIELNIIRSVLRIELTSSLITQPAKRANKFTNRACMFIQLTCLTLSLNKKFEATLVHDIHCISVFTNQRVHQGKHRHQPFQRLAQILVGLQYLSLESFTFYFLLFAG